MPVVCDGRQFVGSIAVIQPALATERMNAIPYVIVRGGSLDGTDEEVVKCLIGSGGARPNRKSQESHTWVHGAEGVSPVGSSTLQVISRSPAQWGLT